MVFEKSKWIWNKDSTTSDAYVDFVTLFYGKTSEKYSIEIAADSNYTVYLNGELAAFGQYGDYPQYKVYDEIDISALVTNGENRLVIIVWYYGQNSQTYIKGAAGLIFEVKCGGKVVAFSSHDTLSRPSRDYISGCCRNISVQLGFTYYYDINRYDGFISNNVEGFNKSYEVEGVSQNFHLRPIKKLELWDRMKSCLVKYGSYNYNDSSLPPEQPMQKAQLLEIKDSNSSFPLVVEKEAGNDGVFIIVDLGSETAGFLDLDIEVPKACVIDIGYGEHLKDGRCRTAVRNFTAQVGCHTGRNKYMNTFRRFGCRYVQIFAPVDSIKVYYLGIRPTVYPLMVNDYKGNNQLRRKVWDVCINTLRQCMHEHYEDTPWREQALYTMDSRNQMLCGYYAFGEFEFPRASLVLISKGIRHDGLLSLCYPAGLDYPIPIFSLIYFIQVEEYINYSKDVNLAKELYPVLSQLMEVFLKRIDGTGLIMSFPNLWNFYEWSEGMSGKMREDNPSYEAPLNAFLSLGLLSMANIALALGKNEDDQRYRAAADSVAYAVCSMFYNQNSKLFESYENRHRGKYSVLTNSVCLLCGAAKNVDKSNILGILESNGADNLGYATVPNTLSMNSFRFDALLLTDREKYTPIILSEIDKDYGYMLEQGATSFWETIKGEADFKGAGSLCHGWSALPIYYYSILE